VRKGWRATAAVPLRCRQFRPHLYGSAHPWLTESSGEGGDRHSPRRQHRPCRPGPVPVRPERYKSGARAGRRRIYPLGRSERFGFQPR
jgi:hypothetical protein